MTVDFARHGSGRADGPYVFCGAGGCLPARRYPFLTASLPTCLLSPAPAAHLPLHTGTRYTPTCPTTYTPPTTNLYKT